ncbi:hypothetical protein [Corynebacterium uterequi]|uniref:Uncharacterized protein n=1 Tax=Corynebacterium uterequi TaxID=1072256 RepID=A0A0G3HG35_9CORY|nr:hypothetical protein [Corynebacterium uterequi]AKK11695.1 hypothetical protein CUTER_08565 [Corynebacterium uterequi]
MLDDDEIFLRMKSLAHPSVDIAGALSNFDAGEPEHATAFLLDDAYLVGKLTPEMIALAESNYDSGPVIEMLEALRMLDEQKNGVA